MAAPAAAVIGGAITLWLALASADGLVADDYYRRGLEVNRMVAREETARRMGLEAEVERAGGLLRVRLAGDAPPALFAHLAHATRAGHDVRLRLVRATEGVYEAPLPELAPGRWRLVLEDPQRRWRIAREAL
jgi:hypothetical protein